MPEMQLHDDGADSSLCAANGEKWTAGKPISDDHGLQVTPYHCSQCRYIELYASEECLEL
jgi:hypothetical protein